MFYKFLFSKVRLSYWVKCDPKTFISLLLFLLISLASASLLSRVQGCTAYLLWRSWRDKNSFPNSEMLFYFSLSLERARRSLTTLSCLVRTKEVDSLMSVALLFKSIGDMRHRLSYFNTFSARTSSNPA
jgi:hypothetical protein